MDVKKQALRINQLVANGLTLEEAIEQVLRENAPVTMANRVEHIMQLENLELLEQMKHRAHAKKSKMKNNAAAVERYNREIEACKVRIAQVKAMANDQSDTIEGLIKMGAKASTVVQVWLGNKEAELEPKVTAYKEANKLTNKQFKALVLKQPTTLPKVFKAELTKLGDQYLEIVNTRLKAGDQRVIALVRLAKLIG